MIAKPRLLMTTINLSYYFSDTGSLKWMQNYLLHSQGYIYLTCSAQVFKKYFFFGKTYFEIISSRFTEIISVHPNVCMSG